ncbi:hypothetical protein MUN76_06420 [Leucobacter rhizosphaerae]|uniref:Uncharacterized protein n=1 Tax=Leucobacter rhizosphaerae TaxID=2932245 RepID=A0ABY4FZ66_9MICO|nr:hypothetical protein [Leucobacter rhizosphaerae]UOQ61588.1 hypothetical protein MUN76_06420 [Leucobacter rhizosphaerae]
MPEPIAGVEYLAAPDGLPAFAQANGLVYTPTAAPPALGAGLWEQASNGTVRDRVSGPGWEAGRITGGNRSASRTEQRGGWTVTTSVSVSTPERSIELGYLAITLPRRLPQMILDARSNDRGPFSSLLHRPRGDQVLSLEGDFDRHFRLYVPTGYERDALYVFTPDLMALCIDETGDLDIEIRDDQLIVTKPGGFDLHALATWQRFAHIRETVGRLAWNQTDRYVDDRAQPPRLGFDAAGPGEVAAGGQRLRKRVPRIVWVVVGTFATVLLVIGGVAAVILSQIFLR